MRLAILCIAAALAPSLPAQRAPARAPDVAVLPLTLEPAGDSGLARLADSCLAHLVRALAAETLTVARRTSLAAAPGLPPARFAIKGTLKREGDTFSVELDLIDAASGDELRSYFNSGKLPADITGVADLAAPRIARAIRSPP